MTKGKQYKLTTDISLDFVDGDKGVSLRLPAGTPLPDLFWQIQQFGEYAGTYVADQEKKESTEP